MTQPPSPHVGRAISLTLSAARRQAQADTAPTEAGRDRHDIAAASLRIQAEIALRLECGGGDG